MPTLNLPFVMERVWSNDRLFGRYQIPRGVSLGVTGATVTPFQYELQEVAGEYDKVYMGGHVHNITQSEADVLSAAGWGAYIT